MALFICYPEMSFSIFVTFTIILLNIGYFELGHDYDGTGRHPLDVDFVTYFGMYGDRRPIAILWYQLDVWGGGCKENA